MKEHPISTILGTMRDISINNNSPSIKIGKIISPPPEIQVAYNNIILDKKDIWISEYLLIGYTRTAKGHRVSGTQSAACAVGAPHTHPIDNDYTDNIIYTDTLKKGDYVSIMPMVSEDSSSQQYIILDKIVHL